MADKVRVTVKEKILIHLLGFTKYKDKFEVPSQVSQDGMAKSVGVRRSHIASALKDLRERELVEEMKARFEGQERRKNAYFLTFEGQAEAQRIKEALLEKKVVFISEDGSEIGFAVSELKEHIPQRCGFLEILDHISDDGAFDIRTFKKKEEEKEEVEEEKRVMCPFCGNVNRDFGLRIVTTPDGESQNVTSCHHCNKIFLIKEVPQKGTEDKVEFIAGIIPPETAPGQVSPPVVISSTVEVLLTGFSLVFMLCLLFFTILISIDIFPRDYFIIIILGYLISIALLFIPLQNVKRLGGSTRRLLILTGIFFMCSVALFLGIMRDYEYELDQVSVMLAVLIPAFLILILKKPMSNQIRSEIALSLGFFLTLYGISSFLLPDLLSSSVSQSPFWVIAGAAMIMTSTEIKKLAQTQSLRAMCAGVGAFIFVFCILILVSQIDELPLIKVLSVILGLFWGLLLLYVRATSEESSDRMIYALKSSLIMGLGLLFILIGILLAINDKIMEGAVEFFIGIPVVWLGLSDARESEISHIGIMIFILVSEVIIVLSFSLL
jgi:DNA-binding MarR family transcriptional regulator